jgi:hypothetical protein
LLLGITGTPIRSIQVNYLQALFNDFIDRLRLFQVGTT